MAKMNAATRNRVPSSEFGLPATRQYPVNDPSHARNAKARASEMEHKGRITRAQEEQIDRKADRELGHKHFRAGQRG